MSLLTKKSKQSKNQNNFTNKEYEVISLKVLIETIDSMVNHEVLMLEGSDPNTTVFFSTCTHQKYFYIILTDFLSKADKLLTNKELNCVELLERICKNPQFNENNSISSLKTSLNTFKSWLDQEVAVDTWLSSIDKQCSLKLKRKDFIFVCGNISKHHFARLTRVSEKIKEILRKNKVNISFYDSLLVLNDFYERFHEDILIYHGSNISEMLNNIRWGIREYLLPEFKRTYQKTGTMQYEYLYPTDVQTEFTRSCYWELMDSVKGESYLRKFKSTKYLKLRY